MGRSGADPESCLESLASEGCDDVLIGLSSKGRIALNVTRRASSASEAVLSAVSDVKRAIPHTRLIDVGPDLVGLTDIAELLGASRQNVRKLMSRRDTDFPLPVHDGKPAIRYPSKVLAWLREKKRYPIDEKLLDVARVNMQCNLMRDMRDLDPGIAKRLRAMVA